MSTEAMNYEAVLAWLEAKRAAADKAIAGIKEMMGLEKGEVPGGPIKPIEIGNIAEDAFLNLSIGDAARKYLGMVRKAQTVGQICEALKRGGFHSTSKNFVTTVYSVLARQEKAGGDVVRVERGQWALRDWHPTIRRTKAAAGDKAPEEATESEKPKGKPQERPAAQGCKAAAGSLRDRAKQALSDAGKPLKAAESAAMLATNGKAVNMGSLEAVLSFLTTHDGSVRRVSPGLYALN